MRIRQLHRWLAIVVGPLLLFTAVTASVLILIKLLDPNAKVVGFEARRLLTELHNYTVVAEFAGLVLAAGVIVLAGTGLVLWFQPLVQRRRRRRRRP
jgi:uncharacterized iron-regulated membrane protein